MKVPWWVKVLTVEAWAFAIGWAAACALHRQWVGIKTSTR